ncbi:hypothetical protein TWF970_011313 [Orbilia oligospora]|uniref:Methyltransferase domain-containing protein n=1 Tax=Orbilia oligospora TaxID=2813651 RepID=A0A7C8RGW4_ORBOL|nr:hypothetical protein TWF970_011313 [Orbilia oligospora]
MNVDGHYSQNYSISSPRVFSQIGRRNMSTTTKEPYLLNVDEEASKRLNLQHGILTRMLGGILIPEPVITRLNQIQESGRSQSYDWPACKENTYVKIADLATGTGIWLYSIRKQLEESGLKAELYGYDLHDNQFPPEDKREDVEFHKLNILDTPKFQEIGPIYHYIHARLLTSVLTKEEWRVAIDNCLEILKPGGFLHFEEIPFGELSIEKDGVPASGGVLEKLQASMKLLKRDLDCGHNIYNYLEELELWETEHRKIDLRTCDEETRQMQNVNARLGLEEFINNAIARGPGALKRLGYESKEAALERMASLGKDPGTQAYFVLHSILGKKPGGVFSMQISCGCPPPPVESDLEEAREEPEEMYVPDPDPVYDQEGKEDTEEPPLNFVVPRRGRFQVSYAVISDKPDSK